MLKLEPPRGAPTRWEGDPDKFALLMAGGAYAPARPLLHYLRKILVGHGWTVQELWWQPPFGGVAMTPQDGRQAWVVEQAETALLKETASRMLLCGKSLATFAIPVAQRRDLPAVWLTPILTEERNTEPLLRTATPALLVGGTADPLWNGDVARRGGHEVLELPGQDHGLEVDDTLASIDTLREVMTAVETYVAELG